MALNNSSYSDSLFTEDSSILSSTLDIGETGKPAISDHVWKAVEGLIGALGIAGNGLVIYVFLRMMSGRSLVNLFIINQSLIDLTTSVVFVILHLGPNIHLVPGNAVDLYVCRFWVSEYVLWALFITSTINLINITLERYIAVMKPQWYRVLKGRFKKRIIPFTIVTWLLGFIIDSYWAFIHDIIPPGFCVPNWKSQALQGSVGVLIFFVTYLCPLSVMVFTYFQIIRQLRHQAKLTKSTVGLQSEDNSQAKSDAKKNVIKTVICVSVVYATCWAPIAFNYLIFNFGGPLDFTSSWYAFIKVFAYANMCANPFIYAMQYRQFQEGLRQTFCRSTKSGSSSRKTETVDVVI